MYVKVKPWVTVFVAAVSMFQAPMLITFVVKRVAAEAAAASADNPAFVSAVSAAVLEVKASFLYPKAAAAELLAEIESSSAAAAEAAASNAA